MNRNGQVQTASLAEEELSKLLRAMCRYPGDLTIKTMSGRRPVVVLTPHQADYGVLCGASGSHLQAIRLVAGEMFAKEDRYPTVELERDGPGKREPARAFTPSEDFDHGAFAIMAYPVCWNVFGGFCVGLSTETAGRDTIKATLHYKGPRPSVDLEHAVGVLLGCTLTGKRLVFEVEAIEKDKR